jgi:hypothetical protein
MFTTIGAGAAYPTAATSTRGVTEQVDASPVCRDDDMTGEPDNLMPLI